MKKVRITEEAHREAKAAAARAGMPLEDWASVMLSAAALAASHGAPMPNGAQAKERRTAPAG